MLADTYQQPPARHLHHSQPVARELVAVWVALLAATGASALLAVVWPDLAPAGRPHPTLHPTIGAISAIFLTNARVLAIPFLLVVFRFGSSPRSRTVADAVLVLTIGASAATVGLALGHNGTRLVPYIPQLPVEYAAAALAAGVWIEHRREPRMSVRSLASQAVLVLVLLALAAALEVLATPHAR